MFQNHDWHLDQEESPDDVIYSNDEDVPGQQGGDWDLVLFLVVALDS